MKSFKKNSILILSSLFISTMSIGFADDCQHATDEVKVMAENVAGDSAEIAEESESQPVSGAVSCGKCGKKGDHYADCNCGKKKKNKSLLELA